MQTDTICAFQLEEGDWLAEHGGESSVEKIHDNGDFLSVEFIDGEGTSGFITYAPFDTVLIITSFDDDEESDNE